MIGNTVLELTNTLRLAIWLEIIVELARLVATEVESKLELERRRLEVTSELDSILELETTVELTRLLKLETWLEIIDELARMLDGNVLVATEDETRLELETSELDSMLELETIVELTRVLKLEIWDETWLDTKELEDSIVEDNIENMVELG